MLPPHRRPSPAPSTGDQSDSVQYRAGTVLVGIPVVGAVLQVVQHLLAAVGLRNVKHIRDSTPCTHQQQRAITAAQPLAHVTHGGYRLPSTVGWLPVGVVVVDAESQT